jgi:hypothetical protein
MQRYNVEVMFPNGTWKNTQHTAPNSSSAAYTALEEYPAADKATAWMPGGDRGLTRTDVATVTALGHALDTITDYTLGIPSYVPIQALAGRFGL